VFSDERKSLKRGRQGMATDSKGLLEGKDRSTGARESAIWDTKQTPVVRSGQIPNLLFSYSGDEKGAPNENEKSRQRMGKHKTARTCLLQVRIGRRKRNKEIVVRKVK